MDLVAEGQLEVDNHRHSLVAGDHIDMRVELGSSKHPKDSHSRGTT